MIRTICLDGRNINYNLVYKNVKNMILRVKADMTVSVSAKIRTPINVVEDFIYANSDFILSTIRKFSKLRVNREKALQYVTGEKILFLGNELPLNVVEGKNKIGTNSQIIFISTSRYYDVDYKKEQLKRWLDGKLKRLVTALVDKNYPPFQKVGVEYPKITFRSMTSRWGSCNYKKKIITFSKELIHYPVTCIEYVVVHELAHFLQPNHSKSFYDIVEQILPDYKFRKNLLSQMQYVG